MGWSIFVLCFKLCVRGLDFKIMMPFLCFLKMEVFCEKFENSLRDQLLNQFQNSNFNIKTFKVKIIPSKFQKCQNNTHTQHGSQMENFKND